MVRNAAISCTEDHYPANERSARRLSYPIPAIYIDFICSNGGLQLQCTPTSPDPLRCTSSTVKGTGLFSRQLTRCGLHGKNTRDTPSSEPSKQLHSFKHARTARKLPDA
jgi:hypothetical protein